MANSSKEKKGSRPVAKSKSAAVKAAYVAAGGVIVAALIEGLFTVFKNSAPHQSVSMVGSNKNALIIGGDVGSSNGTTIVATEIGTVNLKTETHIHNGYSVEQVQKLLEDPVLFQSALLETKYPKGHIRYGFARNQIVFIHPKNWRNPLTGDWDNIEAYVNAQGELVVNIPNMICRYGGLEMRNSWFSIPFVEGNPMTPVQCGDITLCVQVMNKDKGIFVIGFK